MTGQAANDLATIAEASDGVVSPEQTLILFALVARHGFAPQNDLGVPVDAADRAALQTAGLVETLTREHKELWLSLTDDAWDWAGANLTKALPASSLVLHHMMVRIGEHLARTGETLRALMATRRSRARWTPSSRRRQARSFSTCGDELAPGWISGPLA